MYCINADNGNYYNYNYNYAQRAMIISDHVRFAVAFLSTFKEEQNHLEPI